MCKLTENSFRDVNIAFANELSIICDELGIDVWKLINTANRHPRVNILNPGPGVGGHCIAVDPWFIVSAVPEKVRIIRAARQVNDAKPAWVLQKILSATERYNVCAERDSGKPRIAFFGLSFKADIDDLRESPAVQIVEQVSKLAIADILVVEPHINHLPVRLAESTRLVSFEEAVEEAQIIAILVGHRAFRRIDFKASSAFEVIDACGITK
jgi:UDP-N-acetyl-D-mannosaminuronic acid dehydrogenase